MSPESGSNFTPQEEGDLTPVEKARQELIAFVEGEERTSARSKAFINCVTGYEQLLNLPESTRDNESDEEYSQRFLREIEAGEEKLERRVKTNKALVRGYPREYKRVLRRVEKYSDALHGESPSVDFFSPEQGEINKEIARKIIAVKDEVTARQTQRSQTSPNK